MARRVFLHIGLPKTATTYLQTIMWSSRDRLAGAGLLLPGAERRDHLWSSRTVRGEAARRDDDGFADGAWQRVRDEVAAWHGDALVSHEFFAAASAEQARTTVEALAAGASEGVEVLVTAREPLGLFSSGWQESLKNRATAPMHEFGGPESSSPGAIWDWRTLDLGSVLGRWGDVVPSEKVHVLPLPGSDLPRDTIWLRFAETIGVDPALGDTGEAFANSSMGLAEAETLRRVNEHLERRGTLTTAWEKGVYIRTYLADEHLVPRSGERYWPGPEQVEECRRRGEAAVALVRERGFHVVGDVDDLLVPASVPERRTAGSATDAEVAEVATDLVAQLTDEVRVLRRDLTRARERAAAPVGPRTLPARARSVAGRVKRRLTRP